MKNKSNENSKNIPFQLRLNNVSDFETIKKIRNYSELGYDSQSDLLRDAVIQFFENDGQKTNSLEHKIKTQRLRRETAKANVEEIESKEFVKYYETFGSLPSKEGRNAIHQKATNTKQIVQPDGSFVCPRCPLRIAESEVYKQVDRLYYHITNDHNSYYTTEEQSQILAVIEK